MESSRLLPPRKSAATSAKHSKQHLTPLETLLQMGFLKHRAEKALAATGDRGAQLAADWLLAHVHDPILDTPSPREYILYACPTGEFADHLKQFWNVSLELCGRNGAHNCIPHITLVPFFKAPDGCSQQLTQAMQQVIKRELENEENSIDVRLESYISPNFIGFFVPEEDSTILKQIALEFVKEVSNNVLNDNYEQLDAIATCFPWCANTSTKFPFTPRSFQSISLEPHVKSLHLTLAFQFQETNFESLKQLAETSFDLEQPVVWEVRLYSRDSRAAGKQVYKVIYSHIPRETDELELRVGDYVYVSDEAIITSLDGWVEGVSWLTGCSGVFPINYTERTAETDAWTLHRSVPLYRDRYVTSISNIVNSQISREVFSPVQDIKSAVMKMVNHNDEKESQQLFVMRHGERFDFAFGNWIPHSFTPDGSFIRRDLNMPTSLPMRKGYPQVYANDCPITNLGVYEAKLTGEALKAAGVSVSFAYASPSFRCVQTCDGVLQGLGVKESLPIFLEPSIYEWLTWYQSGIPEWMTSEEYIKAGYNIDASYKPFISREKLESMLSETCEEYYDRNYNCAKSALARAKEQGGGNVLLVGHASSLDACTRQLTGHAARNATELDVLLYKVPYLSLVGAREEASGWTLAESPVPAVSNTANKRFDWKVFL